MHLNTITRRSGRASRKYKVEHHTL